MSGLAKIITESGGNVVGVLGCSEADLDHILQQELQLL